MGNLRDKYTDEEWDAIGDRADLRKKQERKKSQDMYEEARELYPLSVFGINTAL